MLKLICTSYTETEQGLVLRNNWIEDVHSYEHLTTLIENWKLPIKIGDSIKTPISDIIEGKMSIQNVKIHIRIWNNTAFKILEQKLLL